MTVPSKTSGPRKAFISLSWARCRSSCASMRTAAAYSTGSAGRSPGSRRSRIRSAAHQDGVRGHLDLEHPVGDVLAHTRLSKAGVAGGALERLELAPSFVDGHGAGLGLELGFDVGVLVLAGDLAHPAARVMADDEDGELGVVAARFGEHGELRAGLGGDERAQLPAHARP